MQANSAIGQSSRFQTGANAANSINWGNQVVTHHCCPVEIADPLAPDHYGSGYIRPGWYADAISNDRSPDASAGFDNDPVPQDGLAYFGSGHYRTIAA